MKKKLKYPEEVTEQAWKTVFACQKDEARYNDHTQMSLSVQDALRVVMDCMPGFAHEVKGGIQLEDEAKFYYEVYRGLMLSELRNLSRFDISFAEKENNKR